MKIAYVASFGNTFFNGVFRKIDSQLSVWRALPGVEVETFFRAVEGVDVLVARLTASTGLRRLRTVPGSSAA